MGCRGDGVRETPRRRGRETRVHAVAASPRKIFKLLCLELGRLPSHQPPRGLSRAGRQNPRSTTGAHRGRRGKLDIIELHREISGGA